MLNLENLSLLSRLAVKETMVRTYVTSSLAPPPLDARACACSSSCEAQCARAHIHTEAATVGDVIKPIDPDILWKRRSGDISSGGDDGRDGGNNRLESVTSGGDAESPEGGGIGGGGSES